MTLCLHQNINIHTLTAKPGVVIWYAKIPDIINCVLKNGINRNSGFQTNELFQKENFNIPFLNADEISTLNRFKALKKQTEWMAGRYLLKQMVHKFFMSGHALKNINIHYQDLGAPFVGNHPNIAVSLSHSHAYTAAACSVNQGQTIGIDIEKISTKPDKGFLKIAFTQNERQHLAEDAARIFRHWTIKEAYLKYIKKGFNESLHKVEVIHDRILHHQKKAEVDIFCTGIDDEYILSVVSD